MNECTSLLTSAHIIADLPGHGNYVWQIIPSNDFEMPSAFGYKKEDAAVMFDIENSCEQYEADSIAELAKMIGCDPDTLVATVDRYNELCNNGYDEDYMKTFDTSTPLTTAHTRPTRCSTSFTARSPACAARTN